MIRAISATRVGLVVIFVLGGCDALTTAPEPSVDDVPLSEIIDLRRVHPEAVIPADGRSYDTLKARIPKNASIRKITFATSIGLFELTNTKQVDVRAEPDTGEGQDKWLAARVVLRSDTTTLKGVVSAMIGDYRDTVQIRFTK